MADPVIETPEQAQATFKTFIEGEQGEEATATQPEGVADPLVEELRGPETGEDPNAEPSAEEGSADEENLELSTSGEIVEKLRKARQEAGTAGYRLNKAREELKSKDELLASYEQRITALESGAAPAPTAESQNESFALLSDDQLDAFVGEFDAQWAEHREDPYMKQAANYAATFSVEAYKKLRQELLGVAGGVQDMHFDQRLERLNIDRSQFDAVWEEPAYAWGATLNNDQRLAALESQAGLMGSPPSRKGAPTPAVSSVPGAQTTSRVSPHHIETNQAVSQVQNPTRLKEMKLHEALDKGDTKAARAAAAPLFEQFVNG